ncbi:MAG: hypothetical protein ACI39U_01245 [Candidatus Cryptobacteroides sp.]
MKIIANQNLSSLGGAGYDSPEIRAVNFKVEAGASSSGENASVETWTEDSMSSTEW